MHSVNFKKANCKSCYKCLRSCPVKAIKFKNDQAEIVENLCIMCGTCLIKCPQNARQLNSDIEKLNKFLENKNQVIISLAPSFVGYFKEKYKGFIQRLYGAGISEVRETAEAATVITNKYRDYIKHNDQKYYITTSCPSANSLIEKYYPRLIKYMMPFVSPMIAHGKLIKEENNGCKVIFIGPCLAKKVESHDYEISDAIDAVITFEEIENWLNDKDYEVDKNYGDETDAYTEGHNYPLDGGILRSLGVDKVNKECISVSGVSKLMDLLQSMEKEELPQGVYEISACDGSCVGGVDLRISNGYLKRKILVENYIKSRKFMEPKIFPYEDIDLSRKFINKKVHKRNIINEEINGILRNMGKSKETDEMNCGVCGYDTCREKAVAVLEGMAETSMCLSFMRSKAENFANIVFEYTPNAVIILDYNLQVIEFNPGAEKAFMIKKDQILGKRISNLLDDSDVRKVKESKMDIKGKRVTCLQYGAQFIQNIVYIPKQEMIFITLININELEKNRKELVKLKENTLQAAQEVIEKQMRVAQEIAGLLGETTAETKVILTKLKKVVAGDEGEIL